MKTFRKLAMLAAAIFAAISVSGCSNDDDKIIWDFGPVGIKLLVLNSQGENLLNESVAGNILSTC